MHIGLRQKLGHQDAEMLALYTVRVSSPAWNAPEVRVHERLYRPILRSDAFKWASRMMSLKLLLDVATVWSHKGRLRFPIRGICKV